MTRRPKLFVFALFALVVRGGFDVAAQPPAPRIDREYQIKASLVGILGDFVIWPANKAPKGGKPLEIGVLGDDPFDEQIANGKINHLQAKARDRTEKGKKTTYQHFTTIDQYKPCHVLFVSDKTDVGAAADRAKKDNVLVIGHIPGLAAAGDVVANLVVVNNRIRLQINPDAARRAGLKLHRSLVSASFVDVVRDGG